jgi:glycerophosphoryl diester phosphodiesterase
LKPLPLIHDKPLVWAHRGGRSLAAENTLRALRLARTAGADGCEIDVQLTLDAQIIVLHDLNLLRTTNAGAHPLFADLGPPVPWRFSLEEIRSLSADVFPRRRCSVRRRTRPWREVPECVPGDVRVPTLAEVLRLMAELGMWLNIEIKDITRAAPPALARTLVERVLACVGAESMDAQVIISSFNPDFVRRSKELAPQVLTALLTPHRFPGDPVQAVQAVNADAWHPGFRHLTAEAIQKVRAAGLAINPYTVNDPETMRRLAGWGVTGLVTDCPQDAP